MLITAQYPHLAPHFVAALTHNVMEQFVKRDRTFTEAQYEGIESNLLAAIGQNFSYSVRLTTEIFTKPFKVAFLMRYLRSTLSIILPNSSLLDIEIALEEVVSNIIEHSYAPGHHGDIEFTFTLHLDRIIIQVDDFGEKGRQYNFAQAGHFASLEELRNTGAEKRGGMGVYLVRKIMDEVTYTVSPGEYNRITMVKIFLPW